MPPDYRNPIVDLRAVNWVGDDGIVERHDLQIQRHGESEWVTIPLAHLPAPSRSGRAVASVTDGEAPQQASTESAPTPGLAEADLDRAIAAARRFVAAVDAKISSADEPADVITQQEATIRRLRGQIGENGERIREGFFGEIGSIGWAVSTMRAGSAVTRAGWNGKGMYLSIVPAVGARLPYVQMRTVHGEFVPWLCSQTDLLATDWHLAD